MHKYNSYIYSNTLKYNERAHLVRCYLLEEFTMHPSIFNFNNFFGGIWEAAVFSKQMIEITLSAKS